MTRFLTTAALLGAMLAAPAWAQTMTSPQTMSPTTNSAANSSGKQQMASAHSSGMNMKMASRRHSFVAGDDSAEMLNHQEVQQLQQSQ